MKCVFFGHRNIWADISERIEKAIRLVHRDYQINLFLVGNNGNFDYMVQRILSKLENELPIDYVVMLSRIDERTLYSPQEKTVFHEGLENVPYRFAISRRNETMLSNADILITYVSNKFSNSYKLMEKARQRQIHIINLYDGEL